MVSLPYPSPKIIHHDKVDGFAKSRKTPFFVIPAEVLRQAQDRELIERPESILFKWLQMIWTPVTGSSPAQASPE